MKRGVLLLVALVLVLGVTSGHLLLRLQHQQELLDLTLARAAADSESIDPGAVLTRGNASKLDSSPTMMHAGASRASKAAGQPLSQGDKGQSGIHTGEAGMLPVLFAQEKESLRRVFPDLKTALGLQQRKAEDLLTLLTEHQLEASQNPPHVPDGQLDWSPSGKPEWVLKEEAKQRERDREIAELIGEEKFQAWEEHRDSIGARTLVRDLRSVLDGSTDPLRDDQIPLVVSALTEAQQRYGVESQYEQYDTSATANLHGEPSEIAAIDQSIARTKEYNEYLAYAASQYLSVEQQEQFERMLDGRLEVERSYRDLLHSRIEDSNGN